MSSSAATRRDRGALRADLMAAATVTLVGIPQCLAYALLCGLPPAYGLVTAAGPGLAAAVVGRSAQVATGPTNTTGLLVLAALAPWIGGDGLLRADGLAVLATLTLLAGLVRLLAARLGGASLVRFLPESVLAGFVAGAGVLIATMQMDEALGLAPVSASTFPAAVQRLFEQIAAGAHPTAAAAAVTASTVALIMAGRRWLPSWPMSLVAVVLGTAVAAIWHLGAADGLLTVGERSPVPAGWPPFALPSLRPGLWVELILPATAIALLGTLELAVTARAGGARPDLGRELAAQGVANVTGSLMGAFPASASLGRSALLRTAGARTRGAAATSAILAIPVLLLFGDAVGWMPQASLAGVLIATAVGMMDLPRLRRLWRAAKATRWLMIVTLGATLVAPLQWAVLAGTGLGLIIHLWRTSCPRVRFLRPDGYRLVPIAPDDTPPCVVVEISGELYYAAIEPLRELLQAELPPATQCVVLDVSHAHELRFAALLLLEDLGRDLADRGTRLRITGAPPDFISLCENASSGLRPCPEDPDPGAAVRRCLHEEGFGPPWPPLASAGPGLPDAG